LRLTPRAIRVHVSVTIEKSDPQRVLIGEAREFGADSVFVGLRTSAF
jgi:hypothetical protein